MAVTPFTVGMTGTNEIPPAVAAVLSASFLAPLQNRLYSQLSIPQIAQSLDKTQFSFSKINVAARTALPFLDEYTDPDSKQMSAGVTTLTAREMGEVITTTSVLEAISGGAAGKQAAAYCGTMAAQSLDFYAAATLTGGTNAVFAGTAGTSAGVAVTDVMTPQIFNRAWAFLSKSGARKTADGYYLAMLTTDQITDLKNATGAGSWTDVFKYAQPDTVMAGEVGTAFGFKVIENNLIPAVNQSGGTVDLSKAVFFGVDAIGQGVTVAPRLEVTFTDKMNRFAHYSWYAMLIMGLVDQSHVFVVNTATSGGNNAA